MPYAELEDGRFYFEDRGEGVPILFFAQTGSSGAYWNLEQVPYFSANHKTVIFDYRGTGRSVRAAGRYSTRQFAEDGLRILEALGITEPVHVVGHSMGGRVAQWFALDNPARTRSLVLFATGPGQYNDDPAPRGITPEFVGALLEQGWPGYHDRMLRSSSTFVSPDVEMVERYAGAFLGQFGTDVVSYCRHVVARLEHETADRLSEITPPTLVIVGEEDRGRGMHGSHYDQCVFLAKSIPGAEFVTIPGGAHGMHVELATTFNAALADFLARH